MVLTLYCGCGTRVRIFTTKVLAAMWGTRRFTCDTCRPGTRTQPVDEDLEALQREPARDALAAAL